MSTTRVRSRAFGWISREDIRRADLFYADLVALPARRRRRWASEDAEAEHWAESGRLVEGPLTDGEWQTVLLALSRGEAQIGAPLTGNPDRDALLVAARIFCDRNALALDREDPLLCLVNDVTTADRRVRALVPHVTARGTIADWPRMPFRARVHYAMRRLIDTHGYSITAAAALVGNFIPESSVIPQRLEGSAESSPLRARNFAGTITDFTPQQVMQRSGNAPKLGGVGLVQWTFKSRRAGLFAHTYRGVRLGPAILFNMDAQLDFVATELRSPSFSSVRAVLIDPNVTIERASDEVAYNYEAPGAISPDGPKLPRTDPRVLKVFGARRASSRTAEQIYGAAAPAARAPAQTVRSAGREDTGDAEFAEDAAENRTRADLRNEVIKWARDRKTFLSESAVIRAIDGRASRPELQQLFDARVAACVPARRRADARDANMSTQLTFYWTLIDTGASQILALLESDSFRCGAASAMPLHREVVDGMRVAWTRSGEALTVEALCRGTAPANCPSTHANEHQPHGGTGTDAAHFTNLSREQIRTVEIAGLFGVDLRTVPPGDRPSTAVKAVPTAAPLQRVSFVAIRKGMDRAIHIGRETPRRVDSWVDDQPWLCLPFIPALSYRLFKRRFWEASFHRQWGLFYSIAWIAGLTNFYRDNTGLLMGVGDISHVVGEAMTDHKSHRVGKDVDCYVLENPPAGSQFPVAFWCSGTNANPEFRELGAPAAGAAKPEYSIPGAGGAAIATPRHTTLLDRYATILAYCVATKSMVEAAVWHAGPGLAARGLALAQAAWDRTLAANQGTRERPGWRATWGFGPTTRAEIVAPRSSLFVGDGSSHYGAGRDWPPHQDHIHVRLK